MNIAMYLFIAACIILAIMAARGEAKLRKQVRSMSDAELIEEDYFESLDDHSPNIFSRELDRREALRRAEEMEQRAGAAGGGA